MYFGKVSLFLPWVIDVYIAAQLTSIPDLEFLSSNFSKLQLIGTNELRDCVKEKTWCFYGDSTLEETIQDIVVLLSGGSGEKAREYFGYVNGRVSHTHEFELEREVHVYFENEGRRPWRRMRIEVPDIGFSLRHHFTGHRNINENGEGISALANYLTVNWKEIYSACDEIVINSGPHDWERGQTWTNEQFIPQLRGILEFLDGVIGASNSPKVYWKGSAWYALQEFGTPFNISFNEIVSSEFEAAQMLNGSLVHFIDVSKVLSKFPLMTEKFKIARDVHIGYSGAKLNVKGSLLWTSVSTQTVLCTLCNISGFSF